MSQPPLYIQLGRSGDILNVLPMLWKDAQAGEKPRLMVAAEYAALLEGVSYVEPVIFEGPHYEIAKAYAEARKMQPNVCCLQVNGPAEETLECTYRPAGMDAAKTPSFQTESWRVAGRLEEWYRGYPLVFDRRSPEREAALLAKYPRSSKKRGGTILLAMDGNSSPFPYAELATELVSLCFRAGFQVLRLPKSERLYDLLALYERAHCLVAIDSAPLHLARACPNLPVFALANDRPLLWNGSAWQPNWAWSCRYQDFPARAVEMLDMIGQLESKPARPFIEVWNAYDHPPRLHRPNRSQLPILPGVCGRDSANTVGDPQRFPMLKDCLRMAMMRARDDEHICLRRPDTKFLNHPETELTAHEATYCYRLESDANAQSFVPVVDVFCARKSWWSAHLSEIPPLILGNDYFWSRALWAIFRQSGAVDVTGVAWREKPDASPKTDTEPPRIKHNAEQAAVAMVRTRVHSLFPRVSEQLETIPLESSKLFPHGYNPSIIEASEGFIMVYRYHPNEAKSTRLAMAHVMPDGKVLQNGGLAVAGTERSTEDPKLFWVEGSRGISWVASTWPDFPPRCVVRTGILSLVGKEYLQPDVGRNDLSTLEKNWVVWVQNKRTHILYQCHPTHRVHEGANVYETPGPRWAYGAIRGGTPPIPWEGKLLRFFHSSLRNELTPDRWRYYVGAYVMNPEPPFDVVRVSTKPILYGSEVDALSPQERRQCHHWKSKIVFPGGALAGDGFWYLSLGVNDSQCAIVKVRPQDLHL